MTQRSLKMVVGIGLITALTAAAGAALSEQPPHVVMTSQQDRQRVMDQLKITMFPSGPGAYLASTYDEKTANPYPTLPDPLMFNNGSKVKTAAQWRKRRAEIVELFDREVYGRRPKNIPKVTWTVANITEGKAGNVPVVTKQLVGTRRQFGVSGFERHAPGNSQRSEERAKSCTRRPDVRFRGHITRRSSSNDTLCGFRHGSTCPWHAAGTASRRRTGWRGSRSSRTTSRWRERRPLRPGTDRNARMGLCQCRNSNDPGGQRPGPHVRDYRPRQQRPAAKS